MLISTERIDVYTRSQEEFFAARHDDVMRITEEEIRASEEERVHQVGDTVEDVLYPHYCASPGDLYITTGFTKTEFDRLMQKSAEIFTFKGRGKRTKISPNDIMILVLNYVRRYQRIEAMAAYYGLKASTLGKVLTKAIAVASPYWTKVFVSLPSTHDELPIEPSFTETSYIVDATVQEINTPTCSFNDRKKWFSGKHRYYCLKSQIITDMKGAALHIHTSIPGATHDLEVFRKTLPDLELIMDHHVDMPAKVAGDKGYQDQDIECLVTPYKGAIETLTRPEKQFNERHMKARVVVENFFGRLKSRYNIIGSKYRGDHAHYEDIFRLCCALVNYEIKHCNHGLRREDGDFYKRLRCSEQQKIDEETKALFERRKQQRFNRVRRMSN
jgi:hypothetical protein